MERLFNAPYHRKFTEEELNFLLPLLPAERKGYAEYREKLKNVFILGEGYGGTGNLISSFDPEEEIEEYVNSPVFAFGNAETVEGKFDITIHEDLYGFIEVEIINAAGYELPSGRVKGFQSLSDWLPGRPDPFLCKKVREVHLIKNELVVAISDVHKKVWCYDKETGINHILPVTSFYAEIMRVKNIREPQKVHNPSLLFDEPGYFTDQEIGGGFLLYNKYWKKINIDYSLFESKEKEEGIRKFFRS